MTAISRKRWAQKAQELQYGQLDHVRAYAEQWRNALISITTLFALSGLIKGPEQISTLSIATRTWVMSLLAAAFLLMLTGSLCAMRAAFGRPTAMLLTGENLQEWEESETTYAIRLLSVGRAVFLLGALCVVAAIGLTWIGTSASARSTVMVVTGTGKVVCGHLVSGAERTLKVDVRGREEHVALADVLVLNVVAKCL